MPKFEKKISPIKGVLDLFDAKITGVDAFRADVFRHEEPDGGFIVDTCVGYDTDAWETGIYPKADGPCLIAEQYPDRESAAIGHQKWVDSMTADPDQELPNLILWEGI